MRHSGHIKKLQIGKIYTRAAARRTERIGSAILGATSRARSERGATPKAVTAARRNNGAGQNRKTMQKTRTA